jgi:hypothetical protein
MGIDGLPGESSLHRSVEQPFEPRAAADVMQKLVETIMSEQPSRGVLAVDAPVVAAAANLLREARLWLEDHDSPFEPGSLELFLGARSRGSLLAVQSLVAALKSTAIELIQVERLVEHRSYRARPKVGRPRHRTSA